MLQDDDILERNTNFHCAKLDGDFIFLDVSLGKYHGITGFACSVYDLLVEPCSLYTLKKRLLPLSKMDLNVVKFTSIIKVLLDKNIILVVEPRHY